jgi:arginine repressor
MAKKQAVSKTQAVRDYLKTQPEATRGEIAAALAKQGIKITPSHVANIKSKLKKMRHARRAVATKPAAAPTPTPATVAAEKPTKNGDTITLDQIRAVAQTVKAVGGSTRLNELLGLIKEIGGVKKFKDLVEAMTVTEVDVVTF